MGESGLLISIRPLELDRPSGFLELGVCKTDVLSELLHVNHW